MNFDFDSLAANLQENALSDKKSYAKKEVDSRFWKLSRDENDNGGALVRFLIDPNEVMFVTLTKIHANRQKGYFVSEWSPTSIGLPCPFNEKFSELWKNNQKETAKLLQRSNRYITNIKILKDPANPENEGKIFLYEMSHTMMEQIKEVMIQTDAMKALDEEPVAVYDPVKGQSYLIKAKMGENKILTYAGSKFADKISSIYASYEEAEKDITANAHPLKEFLEPTNFESYDSLKDMLDRFLKINKYTENSDGTLVDKEVEEAVEKVETEAKVEAKVETTPKDTPKTEGPKVVPQEDDDLEALLAELD